MQLFETKAGDWGADNTVPCPFCKQETTVGFNEHYHFCPNCTAIWTSMIVVRGCKHLIKNKSALFTERESWFKKTHKNDSAPYAFEAGGMGNRFCSKCRAQVILDGW